MNFKRQTILVLSGMLALSAEVARAQQAPPPPDAMMHGGPGGEWMAPPIGERMELLGFEGMRGGKVVTGAPFSATATTTQTLADGKTHITRTSNLYRDSVGRFRREMTLPGGSQSFVVISDPTTGNHYMLQPDQKIAWQMTNFKGGQSGGPQGFAKGGPGHHQHGGNAEANVQETPLGTKMINGVKAVGTQYTSIIQPGQIGNDAPITIVSERWYSPELQMVVMSKRSDPRLGEMIYTVTIQQQQEQPAEKFTVPPTYTVKQGGGPLGMHRFRGGPPPANAPAAPPNN
jgi:hypothetical protein